MPSIVTINTAQSDLSLLAGHSGTLSFDVANTSGRLLTLRARILDAEGQDLPPWLNLSEGSDLSLVAGETAPVTIAVTPPPGVETTRSLQLEVFEVALPEENVDRSAPVDLAVALPEEEVEPEPQGRNWQMPILAIAAVLVLAIGGGLFWLLRDPGLPDVTGLSLAEALAIFEEEGIEVSDPVLIIDGSQVTGTVLDQRVISGEPGSEDVVIELDVVAVRIPDFQSDALAVPLGFILDQGLVATDPQMRNSAAIPANRVFGTSPPVGTLVTAGDEVTILLSTGEAGGGVLRPDDFSGEIELDPNSSRMLQQAIEDNPNQFRFNFVVPQGRVIQGLRFQE